jgi:hypothetical protein
MHDEDSGLDSLKMLGQLSQLGIELIEVGLGSAMVQMTITCVNINALEQHAKNLEVKRRD